MIQALSILIPTYNDKCLKLVKTLCDCAEREKTLQLFEIIVADDGSTNLDTVHENKAINQLNHCFFLTRSKNMGRAAIRNFLVSQSHYPWLLFIDADMKIISDQFLHCYLAGEGQVVDGGYDILGINPHNLRYRYEIQSKAKRKAEIRNVTPYQQFHSSNFLVERSIMVEYPFDERFKSYGYEDVMLGKTFHQNDVQMTHIDNPVGFSHFESNSQFVAKTEQSLQTLNEFREDLRGYSHLLEVAEHLQQNGWSGILVRVFTLLRKKMRSNLCGFYPSLWVFKFYKLGYFLSISKK